ncbi:MAG: T9SS type A sorting domain-containing protein [Candidatus Delongbacteria bacterium]|nr:T9SS type A sorting domain-containing protein [Candidatus Delongbacteria bacterium]MBN2833778.1 T9SS type A sorting domain-containing protein [Candidatus Delongbacteria bacterium]
MNLRRKFSGLLFIVMMILLSAFSMMADTVKYNDNWGSNLGFNKMRSSNNGVSVVYSVKNFDMNEVSYDGKSEKAVMLPFSFLPNNAGAPDLAGESKMIMVPQGSNPKLVIKNFRTEVISNVDVAPAPVIPKDNDNSPLVYNKDASIYNTNAQYPASPVIMSEVKTIRGIDYVMVGVTPFQYNPVTKDLVVYKDIEFDVEFNGTGKFGDDSFRNRYFDSVIKNNLFNNEMLPEVDYVVTSTKENEDFEYIIIIPSNGNFMAQAERIKEFRTKQGIRTGIFTTTEVGGNTTNAIDDFVEDAYYNWTIKPVGVLLIGDYGNDANSITSPIWDNYCISDNFYADIATNQGNGPEDKLPELAFGRMTARNVDELELMIDKFMNYELDPPTDPDYYNHPITALGWQTERWFQICSESVGGFWKTLGKDPVRINAVYGGNPNSDPWSTATNTSTVLGVFGPSGLNYIPASPASLGGWTGGNATAVNNAVNAGAFMLQHRDHGMETGWGEPDYTNSNIGGLNNDKLTYIFSINCLTGKFNYSGECFAEALHRHQKGVFGMIAATEVSYSFVNDTYVWGMYDQMWPNFLPSMGAPATANDMIRPAFANAAGKIFLEASSWPYNTDNKEVTYYLFHHHGDTFSNVYSEVPQNLTVNHAGALLSGMSTYTVTADDGAIVALTVNGEIIGVGTATGAPVDIQIEPQIPGQQVTMVVTKQNYFRFETSFDIIPPNGPYCVYGSSEVNDTMGNNNGVVDFGEDFNVAVTLKNVGVEDATNVTATLSTESDFVEAITVSSATAANVPADMGTALLTPEYSISLINQIPDQSSIPFALTNLDQTGEAKTSYFNLTVNAPVIDFSHVSNMGFPHSGETVTFTYTIENSGHADAANLEFTLGVDNTLASIANPVLNADVLTAGEDIEIQYAVTFDEATPLNTNFLFTLNMTADQEITGSYEHTQLVNNPIILENDFSSFPGDGWETVGGSNWGSASSSNAGGASPEAQFNWNPSTVGDQYLISSAINTAGMSYIDLEFKHMVNHYGPGYELFLVTSTDKTNWHEIASFYTGASVPANTYQVRIQNEDIGSNTTYIAWMFSGDSYQINYWYIDDVIVEEGTPGPVSVWDDVTFSSTSLNTSIPQNLTEEHTLTLTNSGNAMSVEVEVIEGSKFNAKGNNADLVSTKGTPRTITKKDAKLALLKSHNINNLVETNRDGVIAYGTNAMDDNAIGTGNGTIAAYAYARFTADELSTFWNDHSLNSIDYYFASGTVTDLKAVVATGGDIIDGPDQIVLEQDILSQVTYDSWTNIVLNTPVTLTPNTDLWIGYYIELDSSYPMGVFDNSNVADKGAFIIDEDGLAQLPTYGLDYNWAIMGNLGVATVYPWLTVEPLSFNLSASGSSDVTISLVPASQVVGSVKNATLKFKSGDEYSPVEFDIEMTVLDPTIGIEENTPETTTLYQNYPNPFNPETNIKFFNKINGKVEIVVYNAIGEKVETLQNGVMNDGFHAVKFDASRYNSGLYFYTLKTEDALITKKMLLVK